MSGGDRPSTLGPGPSRTSWLPGLETLRSYRLEWLRSDLVAGVVLAAFLVPVGMGYAEAAGLPAITGLGATSVAIVVFLIF